MLGGKCHGPCWVGGDLQLVDPEARPLRVPRAAFHLVEPARVLDALHTGPPASHSGTGFSFRWWDYCMAPIPHASRSLQAVSPYSTAPPPPNRPAPHPP